MNQRELNLATANANRAKTAALVNAERAELALAKPPGPLSQRSRLALGMRVAYPEAPLRELADELGWTKDQFSAALRRGITGKSR